ncbi:hypothetical protein ACFPYJ_22830 [Paenibacillus solisilvae]|uniref:mannan endo-1,4-beta-mannosidase n=1 Tax=Paenibacillus solisilvae TaxID=2486751 RepID=A0ABW0W584_9BACL
MNLSFDTVPFANFITREGDRLFDGQEEFRFISINIPNLHVNEDPLPHWHRVDAWEIENAFKTIRLMEGRATRIYTFSIRGGLRPGSDGIAHIYGPNSYDEQLFCDLDLVLALAAKHGVRVIIPFIDQWPWFGGIEHFAAFFNKSPKEFWIDPEIRQAFKNFISFVINRTNTVTGQPYKEDKAILAWETGNELDSPDEWISDIVSHIRSLEVKQLILDGRYGVSPASVENPAIDIVSNHYYIDRGTDFIARTTADRNLARGKKAFLVGEFGHSKAEVMSELLDEVVLNGTTGAMAWSLRYHNKDGGFYYQGNPALGENHCMNWPGFSSRPGEREKMSSLREHAFAIQGKAVEPNPIPESPELLPIQSPSQIAWRGSAGAAFYTVERAEHPSGPWAVIAEEVHEHGLKYMPFSDKPPYPAAYFYRMCAGNESGLSKPSNVQTVYYKTQGVETA